jgi:hypothetical protein
MRGAAGRGPAQAGAPCGAPSTLKAAKWLERSLAPIACAEANDSRVVRIEARRGCASHNHTIRRIAWIGRHPMGPASAAPTWTRSSATSGKDVPCASSGQRSSSFPFRPYPVLISDVVVDCAGDLHVQP